DRVEIANVPDSKLKHVSVVAVDDVIGSGSAVQPLHPHLVLLRLVPREHDDPLRVAELAGEDPLDDSLPKGTGPSGDKDAFPVKHCVSLLSCGIELPRTGFYRRVALRSSTARMAGAAASPPKIESRRGGDGAECQHRGGAA